MKKIVILVIISVVVFYPLKANASDYMEETLNTAEEYNIDIDVIKDFSFEKILTDIKEMVSQNLEQPAKLTLNLCGVLIFCAIVKTFMTGNNSENLCDTVCILNIFLNVLNPIQHLFNMISDNLIDVKNFMVALLPVFSGISAASGEFMTSALYTGIFLTGMAFVADICVNFIIPSTRLYFALSVSDSLSPYIKLKTISEFYLKSVKWVMRSLVSAVCFLLTIQTAISQGADTLAVKTGKVFTGTAIPVIGSVLQDAVGSVFAGMEAIKGFTGAVGIVGVFSILAPSLVLLIIYRRCFNLLYVLCSVFDMQNIGRCVKAFADITELMISVVILFVTMLVLSITVMIAMTNGV